MDERFRSRRSWAAVAVVGGVIFLCITLCFLGALGTMFLRNSAQVVPPVQPPAIGEDAGQPQLYYGPWFGARTGPGVLGHLAVGAVMVFGLLLMLGIGRFVMGPRRCGPHATGGKWKGHPHPWGPRRWHAHGEGPCEGDEPPESQETPDDSNTAYEGAA